MNPIYYDVGLFLVENGFENVVSAEWDESKDSQILVLEGVGIPSPLKNLYEQPSVQIMVRGEKSEYDAHVWRRANEISKFLLSQPERVNVNGTCYNGFEPGSNIAPLGKDENQRFIYSMNFATFRNA